LDKGITFESIKDILEGIYSDMKKGTRYVVWLGFRVSDDDILDIRDASVSTEVPLPHPVRPKQQLRHAVSAVSSYNRPRRRHFGVAVAIAAEPPWERRGW